MFHSLQYQPARLMNFCRDIQYVRGVSRQIRQPHQTVLARNEAIATHANHRTCVFGLPVSRTHQNVIARNEAIATHANQWTRVFGIPVACTHQTVIARNEAIATHANQWTRVFGIPVGCTPFIHALRFVECPM